jgi:hypothetical protein
MDYIKFIEDRVGILKENLNIDLESDEILDILMDELNSGKLSQVELSNYKILKNKVDWDKYLELKKEEEIEYVSEEEEIIEEEGE